MKKVLFQNLINIQVKENSEPFIKINSSEIMNAYNPKLNDMDKICNGIGVRVTVYEKLLTAQKLLRKKSPSLSLCVTYGYRSRHIQEKYFLNQLRNVKKIYKNPMQLYESIHKKIAVPSVAGHPTGGAVDIVIIKEDGNVLDFGSKQYNFENGLSKVFAREISSKCMENRLILRECMTSVGFAPFDGEWWHFSYGDKEWAYYYKKKYALYGQTKFKDFQKFMI
jgi:zinc D-Ala-D-Ala dipeptidase